MQQAALRLHLPEQRRRRIRSQDVKRRALQAVLFDPLGRPREDIFPVVIEAEDKRAVHLDAVVVQHADAARVVGGLRRLLVGVGEILVGKRLKSDEDSRTSRQRHVANQ